LMHFVTVINQHGKLLWYDSGLNDRGDALQRPMK
jgi:hypothetical protein